MPRTPHESGVDVTETKRESINITDRAENVFETTGRATDHFPFNSYREHQRETIEAIEAAYEAGYKYVLLTVCVLWYSRTYGKKKG